jgi:hypothetical protein
MVFHMARPLRIELPGALYYLTARGNAQQPSFLDDRDRHGFLQILGKTFSDRNAFEKLSPLLKQKARIKEIRSVDRKVLRPDLAQLFSDATRAGKALRDRAMRAAHFEHGTLVERNCRSSHAALYHYATVSHILGKIR